MSLDPAYNVAFATLAAATDGSQTTFTFEDATLLPIPAGASTQYNIVIFNPSLTHPGLDPNFEIVRVTGGSGSDRTVTRAQEGTSGATHGAGDLAFNAWTAKMRDDAEARLSRFWIAGWTQTDLPANQAATDMLFNGVVGRPRPMRNGWITGLSLRHADAITAGSYTAEVYLAGVASGFAVTCNNTNNPGVAITQAAGITAMTAGTAISVQISSTAALAPAATIDPVAIVEVQCE